MVHNLPQLAIFYKVEQSWTHTMNLLADCEMSFVFCYTFNKFTHACRQKELKNTIYNIIKPKITNFKQ